MAAGKETNGFHCHSPLAETAQTVLETRLNELISTRAIISGPEDSDALHQLRIVAKRLRYSLEMFTVCFPPDLAQGRADEVRKIQDVLGRIHDLDVLHDLMEGQIAHIENEAREVAMRVALTPAEEIHRDSELLDHSRLDGKSDGRLGLYKVIAAKADERRRLYDQFVQLWAQWEETGFLDAIEGSISGTHPLVAEAVKSP